MRRLTTQLIVAALITIAFVLTALSGLVLYLPGQLLPVFGLSLLTWRAIHEWSALVLTVAVVAHIVLNRRRVGEMLARLVRPTAAPQTAASAVPDHPLRPGRTLSRRPPPLPSTVASAPQPALVLAARRRRGGGCDRRPGACAQGLSLGRVGTGESAREFPGPERRERTAEGRRPKLGGHGGRPRRQPAASRSQRLACPAAYAGDARLPLRRGLERRPSRLEGVRVPTCLAWPNRRPAVSSSHSTPTAAPTRTASRWLRRRRPRPCSPTRLTATHCRRLTAAPCASSSPRSSATRTSSGSCALR